MSKDELLDQLLALVPSPGQRFRLLFNVYLRTEVENGTGLEVMRAMSTEMWLKMSEAQRRETLSYAEKLNGEGDDE